MVFVTIKLIFYYYEERVSHKMCCKYIEGIPRNRKGKRLSVLIDTVVSCYKCTKQSERNYRFIDCKKFKRVGYGKRILRPVMTQERKCMTVNVTGSGFDVRLGKWYISYFYFFVLVSGQKRGVELRH